MRPQALVLLALVAVALAVPVVAWNGSASASVIILPVTTSATMSYDVNVSNSTQTVNVTIPWDSSVVTGSALSYEVYNNGSASAPLEVKVYDANGTVIADISVQPLSTGQSLSGSTDLNGIPAKVELASSDVWRGKLYIIVKTQVKFAVYNFPSKMEIDENGGQATFTVQQLSGPSGMVSWSSAFYKNGAVTSDLQANFQFASTHAINAITKGSGWSDEVTLTITPSKTASGEYTGDFRLEFAPMLSTGNYGPEQEVAEIQLALTPFSPSGGASIDKLSTLKGVFTSNATLIVIILIIILAIAIMRR